MLSERLELAVRMAGSPNSFADVGADHGYLSAEMLRRNPDAHGVVSDISEKALAKARYLLASTGLDSRTETVVADGLEPLRTKQVETVFILGMGGDKLSDILLRGWQYLQGAEMILSAQTELPLLRKTVYEIGYFIAEEQLAREKDRFYFLLCCRPGMKAMPTEEELYLGRAWMEGLPEAWLPYLQKQERYLGEAIKAMETSGREQDAGRKAVFAKKYQWILRMLHGYDRKGKAL